VERFADVHTDDTKGALNANGASGPPPRWRLRRPTLPKSRYAGARSVL
jgi:hypothetical protein